METRQLGRSGLRVSEISLGSWLTFGATVDVPATTAIVRAALDAGIQCFDTADVYANGAAEEALRSALDGVPRHQLVIATKAFFPMSEDPNDRGLSRNTCSRASMPRCADSEPTTSTCISVIGQMKRSRSKRPCAPTRT